MKTNRKNREGKMQKENGREKEKRKKTWLKNNKGEQRKLNKKEKIIAMNKKKKTIYNRGEWSKSKKWEIEEQKRW